MEKIKKWLKADLVVAVGINLLFLIVYLGLFHVYYETNDDNAMALFAEGAYGGRTSHFVFQNLIWGKLICILAGLFPGIKWYMVLQYMMIFVTFVFMSYILMRLQGKKTGLVSSVFLLVMLGYQTYVIFQWTRTAAITTIGGMIILSFGVEYAKKRSEKIIALLVGTILCIFGSMIRFQFFAIGVVLTGGIVLFRLWDILKKKPEDWKRRTGHYFIVFGMVGILSIGAYAADRLYYAKDEEWSYYLEYTALRSELWDMGFPDYVENQELYESLGISSSDMQYYHCWNVDTEVFTIENMQKLVAAKEKNDFSVETLKNYFREYPKRFFATPIFAFFIIVSLIAIVLNRKRLRLVVYEFVAIMLFELYFFFINRYGLPRIEAGMWMAAIAAVLYDMSGDLKKLCLKSGKWVAVLAGIILATNMTAFSENMALEEVDTTASRNFFKLISKDQDNLYIFTMHSEPYKLETSYDFWQPAQLGDAANVYYMGGWEFNVPIMEDMLVRYGVDNIYKDSINNDKILIVANSDAGLLQNYIKENYDQSANLFLVKEIDGAKIWRIRNKAVELNEPFNTDLSGIESDIKIEVADGNAVVSGYAYKKNSDSFRQRAYLKLEDVKSGEVAYAELTMSNLEGSEDVMNGRYSAVSGSVKLDAGKEYNISVMLSADGELYEILK